MKDTQNVVVIDNTEAMKKDLNSKSDNLNQLQDLLSSLSIKTCENKTKTFKDFSNDDNGQKQETSEDEEKEEKIIDNNAPKDAHNANEGKAETDENQKISDIIRMKPDGNEDKSSENSSAESEEENERSENDDALTEKISKLKLKEEESSDEDESDYLTRGPVTDHKIHSYRYSPLHPQGNTGTSNHHIQYQSPIYENNNGILDFVDFGSSNESYNQTNELNQSPCYYNNTDGYPTMCELSPGVQYSTNSSSPFHPTNFSQNIYGYQTEFSNDGFSNSVAQVPGSSSFDLGSNSFEPLTPPQSVSPHLKEGQEGYYIGTTGENENLKESEDLINIINTINNKTSHTNAEGIPETELQQLREVLEGNEYAIRNEMGVYLGDENSPFQTSLRSRETNSYTNDSTSDYYSNYEVPLTPPKSVSPVQDNLCYNSILPSPESRRTSDFSSLETEDPLIDILKGIDEISPEELNIYLDEGNTSRDLSNARNVIQERCKPNNLDHALRRLSSISAKYLCKKDDDGDTCLMIVYSKPEGNPDFYENIFCLQEKVREIKVCCDVPLGKAKRCKMCGNTDSSKFYTPLSFRNKQGDTALSCAVKTNHSVEIINYLLHGILQCPEDFRRVFDEKGRSMLSDIGHKYPCLRQYV